MALKKKYFLAEKIIFVLFSAHHKRKTGAGFSAMPWYLFMSWMMLAAGTANAQHIKDTVHFKKSMAHEQVLVLSDSSLNALGIDSLLNKIENVHSTVHTINNTLTIGFDTRDIQSDFPDIDSSIDIINENLSLYKKVLDVKNLQMFTVLLADVQRQLNEWRNALFKYDRELLGMNAKLAAFKKDTILTALMADTAFSRLYASELTDLKGDMADAQKSTGANIASINLLQAQISNEYFEAMDLQNQVADLLRKASAKSFGKEYAYLWNVRTDTMNRQVQQDTQVKKAYEGQRRILHYYFKRNWDERLWMFLTGLVFFLWVFRNFGRLKKYGRLGNSIDFSPQFIKKVSILSTLAVMFNLAPLFDIHPPTAYVAMMELLLVIALTILLRKRWPAQLFRCWLVISSLYIVLSFTGILLTPAPAPRIFLLILNIASIIFGFYWLRAVQKYTLSFSGMTKFVSVVFIILNSASVLCNLFGRLSLAKIVSVTAIFGLTQVVGLSVFIQIMLEAFKLQTIVNQMKGGLAARLNFDRIQQSLKGVLTLLSIGIWMIVFSISLNIYSFLFSELNDFLFTSRKIGSTSFQIGNILLFIFIIYISNSLQRTIGSLYGKTEDSWDPEMKKNGSRLAITRLILIIVGFLIAVAASGLPLDKITIVLGALGVGVGLGLQSIVNNLVSGIILIFEQPFRIGDYIELGDKKGRVLDIGIRSSKLVMEEGAEIIMPNGDLLSGRVINWTLRDDYVRIEMPVCIEQGHALDEIQNAVLETLEKNDSVLKDRKSEIILLAINEKSMNINILVWINDVHRVPAIKSDLLNQIHETLTRRGMRMI